MFRARTTKIAGLEALLNQQWDDGFELHTIVFKQNGFEAVAVFKEQILATFDTSPGPLNAQPEKKTAEDKSDTQE